MRIDLSVIPSLTLKAFVTLIPFSFQGTMSMEPYVKENTFYIDCISVFIHKLNMELWNRLHFYREYFLNDFSES